MENLPIPKFTYLLFDEKEGIFKAKLEVSTFSIPRIGERVAIPDMGDGTMTGKVIELIHHVSDGDNWNPQSFHVDVFLSEIMSVSKLMSHLNAQAAK